MGPPAIAIATGTGIVGGGTGLIDAQPDTMTVNVPFGVTVKQVILYWEGQSIFPAGGDNTIIVNAQIVTGSLIGGPTIFFTTGASQIQSSAFRADITALGLVGPGVNNLAVEGLNFGYANDGAGVLVIYDDGTSPSTIHVRDGDDLAFANFAPPLNGTVPQTFNFVPSPFARTASLIFFVGSTKGPISGTGPHRTPSRFPSTFRRARPR